MIDYNELIETGYSIQQINQIEKIEYHLKNREFYSLDINKYINNDADTETLRKIVDGLKNRRIRDEDICELIFDLLSKNKNFDALIDDNVEEWKVPYMHKISLAYTTDSAKDIIECIKSDEFNKIDYLYIVDGDLERGMDVSLYLRPGYSNQQWKACREAVSVNQLSYRPLIEKMNPDNCFLFIIQTGKDIGLSDDDIIKISYEIPYNNLSLALNAKAGNYDFGDLLKNELSDKKCSFIEAFIKKGIPIEHILNALNKYDDSSLQNIYVAISWIKNENTVEKFLDRLKNNPYEKFEFRLMEIAIVHSDYPLLDVIVNNPNPDPDIYNILADIKSNDGYSYKKFSLANLFYNNTIKDVKKYEKHSKLNNFQTMVLASAYCDKLIDETQLNLLRDSKINADVLVYLCRMISENFNIKPYLKDARSMKKKDIQKIYNSLRSKRANEDRDER